ncbi:MAG: YceD family protein [Holophagaceae bacterium]|jgi:uncharacterized protein
MIDLKTLPEEGWRQREEYQRLELSDGSAVEAVTYELFLLPSQEDVYIDLKSQSTWLGTCPRCLAPVDLPLSLSVQFMGSFDPDLLKGGDHVIGKQDLDVIYFETSHLEEKDFVREQIELQIPTYALCTDHCLGLCPQCGKNWNKGLCQCQQDTPPEPSALAVALKKLKLDFKG